MMQIAMNVEPEDLQRRLVLGYTNASRNSGINNRDVTRRHIDGDLTVQSSFARIRDIAAAMRTALEAADWPAVGRHVADEWDNRNPGDSARARSGGRPGSGLPGRARRSADRNARHGGRALN
jgi:galactokinase/mevalonate kinase-like predicted kinase